MTRLRPLLALAIAGAAIALAGCGSSGATRTASVPVLASSTPASAPAATTSSVPASAATTSSSPTSTTSSTTSPSTSTATSTTDSSIHLAGGFTLSSPAFASGGSIPSTYTCDGTDSSLPLSWSGVPAGTKELVLVMRDPDAPEGGVVHWAVAGIDPSTNGFAAGGVSGMVLPGRNSFGTLGYRGPCPPQGGTPHHYVLTLSALGSPSGLSSGFSPDQLQTSALGIATLVGTYGR